MTRSAFAAATLAFSLALLAGCSAKDRPDRWDVIEDGHPTVRPGMSQHQVLALLGQPSHKRTHVVTTDAPGFGFGYPRWWDAELDRGDTVEQWVYETPEGSDEIFFLKGGRTVGHTRFVPKGLVF